MHEATTKGTSSKENAEKASDNISIIGMVSKRKADDTESKNKKPKNPEEEERARKVAACHSFGALANYVGTLESIPGRTETFTGEKVKALILTPNIIATFITTTYGIREQFIKITQHAEKIRACSNIDELIAYIEQFLPSIPTSARNDGQLPAKNLSTLLRNLSNDETLLSAVPSAYGLREKVTSLKANKAVLQP